MPANSQRAIALQSSMSSHARISSAITVTSSPIVPTPVICESQSPPWGRGTLSLTTPTSSSPSTSHKIASDSISVARSTSSAYLPATDSASEATSSPARSPRLLLHLTPRGTPEDISLPKCLLTPENTTADGSRFTSSSPPASSSSSSGLKLKLRGIQAAIKGPVHSTHSSFSQSDHSSIRKRTSLEVLFDDESDTDSEIDIMAPAKKIVKPREQAARTSSRKVKKVKSAHEDSDFEDDDAMFDAGDEVSSPASPGNKLILSTNTLKRSERILDPSVPEHARLIAAVTKAGSEFYDSDAGDLPGDVKETNKPHLFRNVKWGSLATDYTNPAHFTTEPEFTQFVPGRFERLPDGTASDQKRKLIIKLTDKQNRQRIFLNPPPRDWNNQEAITALNKRTVQQIRRNTSIRFREVVEPYIKEEREWILAHLTEGKPTNGWKRLVDEFNREFEGRVLDTKGVKRPERSHSSLTKEVERFGKMYSKGVVPTTSLKEASKKGKKTE